MKRFFLGLLALALVAAIVALALAPTVGNQYRLWRDAKAVSEYRRAAGELDALASGMRLAEAQRENARLHEIALADAFGADYAWGEDAGAEPLDLTGSGVIAVLQIPKLGVTLPVVRGFSKNALARGVVHLEGTSLPVGGEGTHCVLAGQGGGRFAGLLDGLDRLMPGDCFYVQVLQDTMVYEVEAVETLTPSELEPFPADGKADACTLVSAPNEGERLLVHAGRVSWRQLPPEDDTQLLPAWAARLIFAAPLALAGLILLALIEGLRRAAGRRRVKRMKL